METFRFRVIPLDYMVSRASVMSHPFLHGTGSDKRLFSSILSPLILIFTSNMAKKKNTVDQIYFYLLKWQKSSCFSSSVNNLSVN